MAEASKFVLLTHRDAQPRLIFAPEPPGPVMNVTSIPPFREVPAPLPLFIGRQHQVQQGARRILMYLSVQSFLEDFQVFALAQSLPWLPLRLSNINELLQ